ncbi:MAG: cytochrome c [Acidobacteriota bacterium]
MATTIKILLILAVILLSQVNAKNRQDDSKRLYNQGKKIFIAKCANCHGEAAEKPFDEGLPLNERKITRKAILARLGDATDEEKQAVTIYLEKNMKKQGKVSDSH